MNRNKGKLGIRISILLLFILAAMAMAPVGSAYAEDVETPSPEAPEIGQIEFFVTRFDELDFDYLIPFELIQTQIQMEE